jgi:type IV pilus assembly protein PilF
MSVYAIINQFRYVFITFAFFLAGCSSWQHQVNTEPVSDTEKIAALNIELGIRYLERKNYERAKAKLAYALKVEPTWPPSLNAMAYYLESTGEPQAAQHLYKRALTYAPYSASAQNNYGTFLCRQGDFKQARKYFLRAAQQTDYIKSAEAYENAGLCALDSKNVAEAQAYFQHAVRQSADRTVSLFELAEIAFSQSNVKLANEYYTRFLTKAPQTARSLWLGIRIAYRMGNDQIASSYAKRLQGEYSQTKEYQLYRELTHHEQSS